MISLGSMADLSGVRLNSEAAKTRARTSGEAVSLPSPAFITVGSLSNSVFERRTSTGSGLFASLGSGSVENLG